MDPRAPLHGIRVLDLSRILAGPWATQLLADLGAEVIKIERPGAGDDTRHWGPPWLADGDGNPSTESAYFLGCNRGKRSLAIDFTQPEGAELVRALGNDRGGLPFTVAFDARGRIVRRKLGETNVEELTAWARELA